MIIAMAIAAEPNSASIFAWRLIRTIMNPNDLSDKVSDETEALNLWIGTIYQSA
jgi:hypothetical protein